MIFRRFVILFERVSVFLVDPGDPRSRSFFRPWCCAHCAGGGSFGASRIGLKRSGDRSFAGRTPLDLARALLRGWQVLVTSSSSISQIERNIEDSNLEALGCGGTPSEFSRRRPFFPFGVSASLLIL
jgi:hypothetical protein